MAVVVLPSWGDGPVIRMERPSLSAPRWAASIVRSVLNDSSVMGDSSPGGRACRRFSRGPNPQRRSPNENVRARFSLGTRARIGRL